MPTADRAIDLAIEVEGGNRHTAVMHSTHLDRLSRMAKDCNCSIFVKNGRSQAGLGLDGEGYCSFTIASPTGEGLTGPATVLALAPLRAGGPLQDHLMKKHPALAIVEFSDIPTGMFATDAMLKKAPIAFVKCGTISRGRYLTLIGGTTASVDESLAEGLVHGGDSVLDHDHAGRRASARVRRDRGRRGGLAATARWRSSRPTPWRRTCARPKWR